MSELKCNVFICWVDRAAPEWAGRVPPAAAAAATSAAGPVAAAGRRAAREPAAGERLGPAERRLCLLPGVARPGTAAAAVGAMSGGRHRGRRPCSGSIPAAGRRQRRPACRRCQLQPDGQHSALGCSISGDCRQLGTALARLHACGQRHAAASHVFVGSGTAQHPSALKSGQQEHSAGPVHGLLCTRRS